MEKKFLQIILALCLITWLIPVTASAIAPPKVIAERNLEAALIVIGEVVSIKEKDVPTYFTVRVNHIIKGHDHIKKDDQLNVLYTLTQSNDEKINYHVQGSEPVNVKMGHVILLYLEPSKEHSDFFKPLIEGLSVITVGYPLSVKD